MVEGGDFNIKISSLLLVTAPSALPVLWGTCPGFEIKKSFG